MPVLIPFRSLHFCARADFCVEHVKFTSHCQYVTIYVNATHVRLNVCKALAFKLIQARDAEGNLIAANVHID